MGKLKKIREPGGARGLVPSRSFGIQDVVYGSFLDALDPRGRDEIQIALACSKDPRFREFLNRLWKKTGGRVISLPAIAKSCGISLSEFNEWANSSSTQQALVVALRAAPRVARKLVADALEIVEFCERCDGTGVVTAPKGLNPEPDGYRLAGIDDDERELWVRTCPHGSDGKIKRAGSEHAQDRVLELAGLINKKGSAPSVTINFGGAGHQSAIDSLSVLTLDAESERV